MYVTIVEMIQNCFLLVVEVPPSLRGSVDLYSLGGTPSPRVRVWGAKHHKGRLWDWNPNERFFTHCDLGQNHDAYMTCDE